MYSTLCSLCSLCSLSPLRCHCSLCPLRRHECDGPPPMAAGPRPRSRMVHRGQRPGRDPDAPVVHRLWRPGRDPAAMRPSTQRKELSAERPLQTPKRAARTMAPPQRAEEQGELLEPKWRQHTGWCMCEPFWTQAETYTIHTRARGRNYAIGKLIRTDYTHTAFRILPYTVFGRL